MTDYSELKAAALAATPGPWVATRTDIPANDSPTTTIKSLSVTRCRSYQTVARADQTSKKKLSDARYIAAASPEVVLGLIARVEALEAALRGTLDCGNLYGDQGCPTCVERLAKALENTP